MVVFTVCCCYGIIMFDYEKTFLYSLLSFSHGVRAPIPQTQGVLIEQEAPSESLPFQVLDG